jgi:hypothetical protein
MIDYAREMCEIIFAVSDCSFMNAVALKVEACCCVMGLVQGQKDTRSRNSRSFSNQNGAMR